MFTGIIEQTGIIKNILQRGSNKTFTIEADMASELKTDQSLSHDGVCLTVETVSDKIYTVTAIEETLIKTTLNQWKEGSMINLERSMQLNGRLDGHIVQGHVDAVATCTEVRDNKGSWEFIFTIPTEFSTLIIEKGSISINGISLTIFNVTDHSFTVAIIPYTYQHSNIKELKKGSLVNVEFDMIGKYITRIIQLNAIN